MKNGLFKLAITIALFLLFSCAHQLSRNQGMIDLLSDIEKQEFSPQNEFCPEAKMIFYDSSLKTASTIVDSANLGFLIAKAFLELGKEEKAIEFCRNLLQRIPDNDSVAAKSKLALLRELAIAYLRLGERINCIRDHSGESCIMPIAGRGIHINKTNSENAIEIYQHLLKIDSSDLESRWLLNIAYMTIGGYPQNVPPSFLIRGLDEDTSNGVKPFVDAAVNVGLNTKNMAGGTIIEDFNNDGYLDLVTSSWGLKDGMHYCRNNTNGTFTDVSDSSGLGFITGGSNMMQTDYNNDGFKDIFVLRGGWKGRFGKEPNSLLRNNGDGTFTDVTEQSGLLSFHPKQTATWADFNNDGWLDVFIGNESTDVDLNPCELYLNNKNGTFTEIGQKAGVNITAFVKGVTSGDYNNDGLTDIFISTLNGWKILFRNEGVKNGMVQFKEVSIEAGLSNNLARTFPTWFWDYDNDGWLDILVCGYEFSKSLAWYSAQEALNIPVGNSGKVFLYRNNHDGTFEDVSKKVGLNKVAFAMGANFGDIDNDGWLDMYLGTGNPLYQSLVPNKMFKNNNGQSFIDVTTSARVGNLQKGHGISFADFDYDGDQDIYIDMGGAYEGDAYESSLYINPGQNDNHQISISLEGTTCNRAAIGTRIKVSFRENGVLRSVYRDVNSGGSFGSNPLMQHIGIGKATTVESIEIKWHGTKTVQTISGIKAGEYIKVKEGNNTITRMQMRKVDFTAIRSGLISCGHK